MSNNEHQHRIIVKSVVCKSIDGIIGINNVIPWHIPQDLKHFYRATKDSIVIVGRKTFETLPKSVINRGQRHWVVTSTQAELFNEDNVHWAKNPVEALTVAYQLCLQHGRSTIAVAGGASIYHALHDYIEVHDVTTVDIPRHRLIETFEERNPDEAVRIIATIPTQVQTSYRVIQTDASTVLDECSNTPVHLLRIVAVNPFPLKIPQA